ncbi:hypothetical protein A2U01_0074751, partial [Trifolium medium]|nr:hypothetical protein [Trifolium medium]
VCVLRRREEEVADESPSPPVIVSVLEGKENLCFRGKGKQRDDESDESMMTFEGRKRV